MLDQRDSFMLPNGEPKGFFHEQPNNSISRIIVQNMTCQKSVLTFHPRAKKPPAEAAGRISSKMRVALLSLLAVAAAHAASPVALGPSRGPTLRTAAAMPASNLGAQSRDSCYSPRGLSCPVTCAGNAGAPSGIGMLPCAKARESYPCR